MQILQSSAPLFAQISSLAGAFLVLFTGEKRPDIRDTWTMVASVVKFLIILSIVPGVLNGNVVEFTIVELYKGISLQFRVDAFGAIFALLASFLWIVVSIYSIGYMRSLNEHARTRFNFCFALAIFSAAGVAMAGNIITLYMFYEILTVATFLLVAHKETPEAIKSGRKYLTYLLGGAAPVLFAMAYTYHLTGTLDFTPGGFLKECGTNTELTVLFVAFIIGFGTKAAVIPFQEWLPSAMVAPTPVSALLHAVAVVKAGVFCCLRIILYVFGPSLLKELNLWLVLAYFVAFTVITANLFALTQDNLKRRLAFSTINNLSIIILGAALLSSTGIKGSMLHIPFHGFMKITLFMCAGAIYVKTGRQNISEMDGIGKQMPVTMAAFTIGAAGLTGLPPVNGLISKWYLCLGSIEAEEIFFLFIFLASAILDAAYFFPVVYSAFFKKGRDLKASFDEAPFMVVLPIAVTAVFSVALFFFPDLLFNFYSIVDIAVAGITGGGM